MLTFRNVSLRLEGKEILKDVSFSMRPGRLTALMGPNGSGKSTLLACVNRQVPYTGQILLGTVDLAAMTPRERARALAILPQSLPAPHITGRELVSFGRSPWLDITGRLTRRDRQAVERALVSAGAEELGERYVDTLSGGEGQRVALAMILAQDTPIALLDEPTAHMDQVREGELLEKLTRLKGEKTFLAVLHDLNGAVRYADDLAVLEGGRLVFAGSREECLEREVLERTFGLRRYTWEKGEEKRIFFSSK